MFTVSRINNQSKLVGFTMQGYLVIVLAINRLLEFLTLQSDCHANIHKP